MRRALLLLPLLAIAAGCEKETPQGAVKVTVSYKGFLPGCVRVTARQGNGGEGSTALPPRDVTGKGERGVDGEIIVAVLPPDDWTALTVEAQAFERACEGSKEVVRQSTPVTLTRGQPVTAALSLSATDGDLDGYVSTGTGGTDCRDTEPNINPGAPERCNDVDDNCNGVSDQTEFQLGQACTKQGETCQGTNECAADGTVACANIPAPTLAYPDTDRDSHGDRNATAEPFCGSVPQTHSVRNTDCDDTRANVYAGATELCDGRDNDCDNTPDEGFPNLNQPCTISATQCSGQFRCTQAGDTTACVPSQQPSSWYVDEDGDGFGGGTAVESCPSVPGRISQGGDCNDGNPYTHQGATELCDELDNNCDGQPEAAAVCPAGGPDWTENIVGSSTQVWQSISTWTPGGVWAVGQNNHRAVLTPSGTAFNVLTSAGGSCGSGTTSWYTVWADPQNGRAYFGSAGGRLARQDPADMNCTQLTTLGNDLPVRGLVGYQDGGSLTFAGASGSTTPEQGAAFFWDGNNTVTFNLPANILAFTNDIHGRTRSSLFAVGGYDGTTPNRLVSPRIYRYNPNNTLWESQLAGNTPGDQLKGVWVVNDRVAFAVGNAGTVFRWNGTQWSRLAFPHGDAYLSSVIAFGASSVYVTGNTLTNRGRVYRYDGQTWEIVHEAEGIRFIDITGTSPADLWVAGDGGRIYHWPR